jgi:hypothetical protein
MGILSPLSWRSFYETQTDTDGAFCEYAILSRRASPFMAPALMNSSRQSGFKTRRAEREKLAVEK